MEYTRHAVHGACAIRKINEKKRNGKLNHNATIYCQVELPSVGEM
jgi:hypothetical protein